MARPKEFEPTTAETPVQPEDANNLVIQLPQVLQDDLIANPLNSSLLNEEAPSPEIPDIILGVVSDARKVKYLIALVELGNRSRAARIAKISPATVWQWRRSDPKFAAAEKRAMEVAIDLAEDELVRRATEGVVEPVPGGRGSGLGRAVVAGRPAARSFARHGRLG